MALFKDALKQAVRALAFKTSVDKLKKQGIEQVSVLGMDRIVGLIEESVHRSLKSRLVGLDREAVAEATKAEFLRLLRSNEDLRREKSEIEQLKEQAEDEIDQLRRELAKEQRTLDLRMQSNSGDDAAELFGAQELLAQRVREVFVLLQQSGEVVPAALEQRVLELVAETVGAERRSGDAARQALRDREVENLQRRIQKLTQSLTVTEDRLRHVAAMKNIEDGIASIYRDVQGLDGSDGQRERKKELMAGIFAANLRLQKGSPS